MRRTAQTGLMLATILAAVLVCGTLCAQAPAKDFVLPAIPGVGPADTPQKVSSTLQILFLLTILSLAPSILIMTTCFTRIIIVLSLLRQALATQQLPPNQVLIWLLRLETALLLRVPLPFGVSVVCAAEKPGRV